MAFGEFQLNVKCLNFIHPYTLTLTHSLMVTGSLVNLKKGLKASNVIIARHKLKFNITDNNKKLVVIFGAR